MSMETNLEPTELSTTEKTMGHLVELRRCLLKIITAVSILFLVTFIFANSLFSALAIPLLKQLPNGSSMIATGVTGTFVAPLKLSFFIAVLLAIPYILYQLWSFLAPGLYRHERLAIWPLLISSTLLFYSGVAFAYFIVFPLLFKFFISIAPASIQVMPDLVSYLDFSLKMFFAFGLAFEVPIFTLLLIGSGVVEIEQVQKARPYVIVAAFTLGMLLTPPDVISQIMLAIPLYFLFEAGVLISRFFLKKQIDKDNPEIYTEPTLRK